MDTKQTQITHWTVDVELDWGGRTTGERGLKEGIPKILEVFRAYKIKGLFFISTEILPQYRQLVKDILSAGHEVGSHGHFHICYKDAWRYEKDRQISKTLLSAFTGSSDMHYRAPKFSYNDGGVYATPANHVGLLKHMWTGAMTSNEPIFYLHPFDIVKTEEKPPNLFCKLWYSQPERAYASLINLACRYSHL